MKNSLTLPLSVKSIIPYFQPIIGADQRSVIGYEILGRYVNHESVLSLGSFFHRDSIDIKEKCYVDRWVRTKALEVLKDGSHNQKLFFFNISPDLFTTEEDHFFYEQLHTFQLTSILQPDQVVLEITETDYFMNETLFLSRLEKYRTLGCKIAVDDFGRGFSNLKRVALLKPHILKIDLHIVQKSIESQSHRDILHSLSILSQRIGAQLLFEGIETTQLLETAWKHGAQYYQGYLLAKPSPSPAVTIECTHVFRDQLENMIQKEISALQLKYNFEEKLNHLVKESLPTISLTNDYDQFVEHICRRLPDLCFRVYICDRLGYQISGNHLRDESNKWNVFLKYLNKNWSWRPYFLQNIVAMEVNQKGFLSDVYTDIETSALIQTFSYPVHKDIYLFIDIM
ncbi:EAL domain-containing protein [Halalkalibacter alkalisediminis]|uniref:EAL-associated domain-containing protein n=1 Tax=Halalkalibacter alkalisediminis TaxID=935616 RepID=A0ABV6NM28_9BACI|nr:EAL-associated domain-containing protein [Halalkalibacter alkalisediminis]